MKEEIREAERWGQRIRKDSDANSQLVAVFHGEKTYKLPEKDCVLALWASWEEGFFGLPEVLGSPKSLGFPH